MRPAIATLCALLLAVPAAAEIYKTVDANGNVVYTDVPPKTDGAPVQMAPLNSYEPSHVPRTSAPTSGTSSGAALDAHYYSLLQITEPADDEAVRENAGNVAIAVAISPALRGDHRLVLVLDDTPVEGDAEDNVFQLTNLDRGTHVAAVEVVDAQGALVAESAPVTFHVLRAAFSPPVPTPHKNPT